jgi:hypothetical protein
VINGCTFAARCFQGSVERERLGLRAGSAGLERGTTPRMAETAAQVMRFVSADLQVKQPPSGDVRRHDRLGGLVHEYYRAAA